MRGATILLLEKVAECTTLSGGVHSGSMLNPSTASAYDGPVIYAYYCCTAHFPMLRFCSAKKT